MSGYLAARYNMQSSAAPAGPFGTGVHNGAVTGNATAGFFDPENPALWLLGIGAATLGLIAVNTSLRLGPVHASAGVGKK